MREAEQLLIAKTKPPTHLPCDESMFSWRSYHRDEGRSLCRVMFLLGNTTAKAADHCEVPEPLHTLTLNSAQ